MENKNILIFEIQKIIDFIAANQKQQANQKLVAVSQVLDDLLDTAEMDEELVELHKYQLVLNHLNNKINS
jgi:hypothetical protein